MASNPWGLGISLKGQNGSMIYFASGAPTSDIGVTNDVYFDTNALAFYQKTASGWPSTGIVVKGTMGVTGVAGASFYSGSGSPTMSASNGDLYLNLSGGEIYKYVSGAWTDQGYSIQGPQGARGTVTTSGTAIPTTSAPANSLTGDRYIVQGTGEVYGFDGSKWNDLGYSLIGPQGTQGIQGTAGQRGSQIYNGHGAPTATTFANAATGDMYIDVDTGNLYFYTAQ